MENRKTPQSRARQVVVTQVKEKVVDDKDLFYLFTVNQIEEVLPEMTVQAVPFSPGFLEGMCCWRGLVLPVLDLSRCVGGGRTESTPHSEQRYIVARTGTLDEKGSPELQRCVLKVSDTIEVLEVTDDYVSVPLSTIGVESSLVMGAYQQENKLYMVPDLVSILDNKEN
jgi:chemotaxis signal transduction protein